MALSDYLANEREEMQRFKWIESEKAGRDLGQAALIDWIDKHAESFRRYNARLLEEHSRSRD